MRWSGERFQRSFRRSGCLRREPPGAGLESRGGRKYLEAATAIGHRLSEAYRRALDGIRAVKRGQEPKKPDALLLRDVVTVLIDCGLRPEECFRYFGLGVSGGHQERPYRSIHPEEATRGGAQEIRGRAVRPLHLPAHLHNAVGETHRPVHSSHSGGPYRHEHHEAVRSPERCGHSGSNGEGAGWAQNWAQSRECQIRGNAGSVRNSVKVKVLDGATRRDRTGDLLITNPFLTFLADIG